MPTYTAEELETCSGWTSLPLDHDDDELVLAINDALEALAKFMAQDGRIPVTPIEIRVTGPQAQYPDVCVALAEVRAVDFDNYGGLHGGE